ncbi:thioredoxin family protein [Candidatus Woesearchaeota archaeon]|nr:thioredoxin family protein [Candidatus Woesearchaeota archaeon]
MGDKLVMFYGEECDVCHDMFPLLDKLEKELNVKIARLEVWHNSKNDELRQEYDKHFSCEGVPFFFNTQTKKGLCGRQDYKKLKEFFGGK